MEKFNPTKNSPTTALQMAYIIQQRDEQTPLRKAIEAYAGEKATMAHLVAKGLPLDKCERCLAAAKAELDRQLEDDAKNGFVPNVKYLLDKSPYTLRDMSGDISGIRFVESLVGSLVLTFTRMENALKTGTTLKANK